MKHISLVASALAGFAAFVSDGTASYMFLIASVCYLLVWFESY